MIDVLNTEFITYGFKVEIDKIQPLTVMIEEMKCLQKPVNCGLWGSPVNSMCGWKDWCECERFRTETLNQFSTWKLKPGARIRVIDSYEDLIDLMDNYGSYGWNHYIDFLKMKKDYDGMMLTESGVYDCRVCAEYKGGSIGINTWDCESIIVWNPEVVEVLSYHKCS